MSVAASPFSLRAVEEPTASDAVDVVAELLAENRTLARAFASFLNGIRLDSVPSMSPGAYVLEASIDDSDKARALLDALDRLYSEVEDVHAAARAKGHLLERYMWHRLARKYPYQVAACEVLEEGRPISSFKLDAATSPDVPAVGLEAKWSEWALVGGGVAPQRTRAAKAGWVIGLLASTDGGISGAFVTWGHEPFFRKKLADLVGDAGTESANVIAHIDVADLPSKVAKLMPRGSGTLASA